jgi:hypothetical protein
MIHIHRKLESETLYLPELKPLIGRTVEITIEEQPPAVSDEFYAELGRLPETVEVYEAQKAIFQKWRSDARFEPYWQTLDHALARSFEQVQKWSAAIAVLPELEGYDFDAHRIQNECDIRHAGDHVL